MNFKTTLFSFLVLTLTTFSLPGDSQIYTHPESDDEFIGPFPSWINIKRSFGAIGDSVTDETAALQKAFDAIGIAGNTASVIYLEPGTYRISSTLKLNYKTNISFIGADPETTRIIWSGQVDGTMLEMDGTSDSRFNRITFDGKKTAAIAVDQSWANAGAGYFDAGNEYADDVFKDLKFGIHGGHKGHGFAEVSILRCKFFRNTGAGISLGNFNALDVWVWNSVFEDCHLGVTNGYGAGNFKVYNCIFRNSTSSDVWIGHTGQFAFRNNFSINSRQFIGAALTVNPAAIIIQGNTIVDPLSEAININNQGGVTLIDNIIRSREGVVDPVVIFSPIPNGGFYSMGNTFTVQNPLKVPASRIVFRDTVVSRSSLSTLKEPILPGVQPNLKRKIFEVPVGSNAAAIQNIINQASALSGSRPVVHLPHGVYHIESTLFIPAGSDVQIVGDGAGDLRPTFIKWVADTNDPVIHFVGPSKATLRDFTIDGKGIATNILATNVDQPGSRFFMQEVATQASQINLKVNGLDRTRVLAYNSGFSNGKKSIDIIGGPLAAAGNPQEGRTILYGGAQSDNMLSHEVSNGGNLLVRDVWYESSRAGQYLKLSGAAKCTIEGSNMAAPSSSSLRQISITDFTGTATFLNTTINGHIVIKGNGSQSNILGLNLLSEYSEYIIDSTSPKATIRSLSVRGADPNAATTGSGSYLVSNIGVADEAFLTKMLHQARSMQAEILSPLSHDVSDIRLYRVWLKSSVRNIELRGSDTVQIAASTDTIGTQPNDTNPTISINSVSAFESEGEAVLTISLSKPSTQTITVFYNTEDGTAISKGIESDQNLDFVDQKNQMITIAPGVKEVKVKIFIIKDMLQEETETFTVELSKSFNATIAGGKAAVSILNGAPGGIGIN